MNIRNVRVLDPLVLMFRAGDYRSATVMEPITYAWTDDAGDQSLTVKAGTRYNGVGPGNSAFIWILEFVVQRWGRAMIAALPHDEAFETRFDRTIPDVKAARKYADQLFLAILVAIGPRVERGKGYLRLISSALDRACWVVRAHAMYRAVRWFGAGVWNAHDPEFRR